jgi:hypothetical protein
MRWLSRLWNKLWDRLGDRIARETWDLNSEGPLPQPKPRSYLTPEEPAVGDALARPPQSVPPVPPPAIAVDDEEMTAKVMHMLRARSTPPSRAALRYQARQVADAYRDMTPYGRERALIQLRQEDPELGSLVLSLLAGHDFRETEPGLSTIERAARVDAASNQARGVPCGFGPMTPEEVERLRNTLPVVSVPPGKAQVE